MDLCSPRLWIVAVQSVCSKCKSFTFQKICDLPWISRYLMILEQNDGILLPDMSINGAPHSRKIKFTKNMFFWCFSKLPKNVLRSVSLDIRTQPRRLNPSKPRISWNFDPMWRIGEEESSTWVGTCCSLWSTDLRSCGAPLRRGACGERRGAAQRSPEPRQTIANHSKQPLTV